MTSSPERSYGQSTTCPPERLSLRLFPLLLVLIADALILQIAASARRYSSRR